MKYVYRGHEPQEEIDRHRWARLDIAQLTLEQLAVCAASTKQRHQEAIERRGLSLEFAEPFLNRHGGREGLLAAVEEVYGG
jgi:hypothetical protein